MNLDKVTEKFVSETAKGVIRVYGPNALIQTDLIVARMARYKDNQSPVMWREIARAVRKRQPYVKVHQCPCLGNLLGMEGF